MLKQCRFIQCDVFREHPTKGNALAVVLDSDRLCKETICLLLKELCRYDA